jgi:hypothetical protein
VSSSPSLGAVESRSSDPRSAAVPSPSGRPSREETGRLASGPSSLDTNFPLPMFDQLPSRSTGGLFSYDSANAEGVSGRLG